VTGSGSSGTLTLDPSGRFQLAHLYPKLTLADRGVAYELSDASVSSNGRLGDEGFIEPARVTLSAKAFRADGDLGSAALSDVSFAVSVIPHAESIDVRFAHALGPGHVEQRGTAHRWNRFALQITLADIARAAVVNLGRELRRIGELPASDAKRLPLTLEAFSNAREALLARDPTLSLDHLTFEGPDGTLSISGTARVDRSSTTPAASGPLPLAVLIVARVSISRGLARAWIASSLQGTGGDARAMADEALGRAAAAGLFHAGADPIVVEIVAKEGRVLANGLSAERLAELKAALLPQPPPRGRAFEVPPALGQPQGRLPP
jgi:hypothetical protein